MVKKLFSSSLLVFYHCRLVGIAGLCHTFSSHKLRDEKGRKGMMYKLVLPSTSGSAQQTNHVIRGHCVSSVLGPAPLPQQRCAHHYTYYQQVMPHTIPYGPCAVHVSALQHHSAVHSQTYFNSVHTQHQPILHPIRSFTFSA